MRIIAVMNQKGGVGKTTTSVNLAAGLALSGSKVLLIDLDPQGHSSLHLGVEATPDVPTVYDVFSQTRTLGEVRHMVSDQLFVAPSNVDLAAAEVELVDSPVREIVLRDSLKRLTEAEPFDYVIMDCPPSLGVLTVNALTAAHEVFIPLQPHFFALQGLSKLLSTTALVCRRLNRQLRVTGVVLCLYETGTRLAADVCDNLKEFLRRSDPEAPWASAKIFESRVRRNIKLAESPSFGQSIFDYAPKCSGAMDYAALVGEVLAMERPASQQPAAKETVSIPMPQSAPTSLPKAA
jgi:chromosome partitioning protein